MEIVGVGLSLGAMVEGTKAMVEYGASIKHLSEQANISTDAFQQLAYAAAGAGLKGEEMAQALTILNRNMAQAADGATKQNRAIADLGLNTAELLALPVESQIEAIAKAYVGAADKGKAWADVVALLGRNSARVRELLNDMGQTGIAKGGFIVSPLAVQYLDDAEKASAKLWLNVKGIAATSIAGVIAMVKDGSAALGRAQFGVTSDPEKSPEAAKSQTAAQMDAQLQATIQTAPAMVSALSAMDKALADLNKAYEGPAEAAKRLRMEAEMDMRQAEALGAQKYDAGAQLEAVKLRTEAAKLAAQANQEDAKAAKEKAQYDAAEAEMSQRMAQNATKLLPVNQQLTQAKQHEADLTQRLGALDANSLTFRQDHLKTEEQILTVRQQIAALEEKDATARVEQMAKDRELTQKREEIAIAAIEHDYNLTDTQKWDEKRAILQRVLTEQEQYIANMKKLANDPSLPQGARDKAGNAASAGANAAAGTQGSLAAQGPDPKSFTENWRAGIVKLRGEWDHLQGDMAKSLTGAISSGLNSVSGNISKLILGAQSLGQTFRGIAVDIGTTLVQAFVDMGVKWLAQRIMMAVAGKAIAAGETAALIPIAMAQSAIWSGPATLATIASFGGAAAAAPMEMLAAIGESQALALAGFEDGGYTGGREGRVAGRVHGEEFVWSAPAVRNIGVGNLERAHQAAINGGSGVSSRGGASGGPGNIIVAMSPEDVARSQRKYTDAHVQRVQSKIPRMRFAT